MSRSGYSDDLDNWHLIRWRGAVRSAIRGKRGQAFLREMLAALDAKTEKRLICQQLELAGEVCALGAVGVARGQISAMAKIDPDDRETVAAHFSIPHALACEIMFENDEGAWKETPDARYARMRNWIAGLLAQGIEARSDETPLGGSALLGESPVGKADAP